MMDDMVERILEYMQEHRRFLKQDQLKKKLGIKGEEQTESFSRAFKVLVEEGSLFFDEKKGYRILENSLGVAFGELEVNKAGNGFVYTKDGYNIFVEQGFLNGALDGDKVLVNSIGLGKKDDFKGEIFKVVKRKTGEIICEVSGEGKEAVLVLV